MRRVEIMYGGAPFSLSETTAAEVRESIDRALDGSASRWITVNQGEGEPRETSILITSGVAFSVADVPR
ncbi:hypothetical protein C5C18_14175 [Rathayibacter tritici]|uniref:Uncharacterized protein n=1 Tax=Rathayibacter tritici TaxID=33888 RepID=A0A160KQB2_9MICO|nr:hypothetical protein [Rathayibacter tritici]AND15384.1 hypothetical protein A6122_0220 [Rathayibacter tritici]PPF25204.1 hypothetical protein C5C06_12405 [Rathayibacter tritici]PPF62764.1 hypothetical protein C5C21_13850 [Rathayibacter tritici]PPG03884.1 hypothetical protein C5C18_14175 [Rathayibacter tritici]PPI19111.1 hypothetical protein C5D07_02465 [Rathayibacter tritici]